MKKQGKPVIIFLLPFIDLTIMIVRRFITARALRHALCALLFSFNRSTAALRNLLAPCPLPPAPCSNPFTFTFTFCSMLLAPSI